MTSSFTDKGRAEVLDWAAEIPRSEIGANDLILPTPPNLYLLCLLFQEILQLVLADVVVVVTSTRTNI